MGGLKALAGPCQSLSKEDGRDFATRLKPWIDELHEGVEPGTARCIPLDDFVEWEAGRIAYPA